MSRAVMVLGVPPAMVTLTLLEPRSTGGRIRWIGDPPGKPHDLTRSLKRMSQRSSIPWDVPSKSQCPRRSMQKQVGVP